MRGLEGMAGGNFGNGSNGNGNNNGNGNLAGIGQVDQGQLEDIRNVFEQQLEEKNRTIEVYRELIGKLRKRLSEKY